MALDQITVTVDNLEALVPNIDKMKFSEQVSFTDVIDEKKRQVFGQVKQDYLANYNIDDPISLYAQFGTNAEIDTLLNDKAKDLPVEEYLKNIIIRLSIAEIFRQNRKYEDAEVYEHQALQIPIKYYIDSDADDVVDTGEKVTGRRFPTFHR